MKAHDAIVRLLVADGIDTIFALMSEGTMRTMSTIEEEWGDEIRLVKTRHEQGAMAMADGYSRAGGGDRVGVCLVGRGPAIAQTGTAMVTARKKGSNLLVVVPESPLSERYDVKRFEQETYLRSTIGNVTSIRSRETLVDEFGEAIRRVRAGDGPLAVQIPWDVLDGDVDVSDAALEEAAAAARATRSGRGRVSPDRDLVERAVDMYVDSDAFQPPVVLAGRGAMEADAKEAIEEFAERTSALLATTLQARNYFADHPYYLGFTGSWGTPVANRFASEASLVVAVGASLNPYTIDDGHVFGEETRVIHVDRDPLALGRHAEIDLGIAGDARVTVEALTDELDRRGIHREGELWTDDLRRRIDESPTMNDRTFPKVPGTIDPRELVTLLNEHLPESKRVVVDAGHHTRWCLDGIHTPPEAFTFTLDFASIGLGLPMGVGTALASDDPCVTICGDAGFLMSLQEVETAVRNEIPVTIVVVNDASLGSEYHSLDAAGEAPDVALVSTPDFADVAESLGADGVTVRTVEDLEAITETIGADRDGPLVIDCKVNHEVRHRSKG
ncbi:thiamine pyrophosphate-binding protein [Natrialbaceae archaeon GCM10025810]|uniref:thiamine pyrophosphate-binding protein n=1 Tax=Halovalidus salilacus TaxID=3075124 RepID=UPI00360E21AF